jgi:hypothetical protein
MTKAKTIHARRKFKNWWPCQKFRVSAGCTGPVVVAMAPSLAWFHCSANSVSFAPATFRATDPQISQVLQLDFLKKYHSTSDLKQRHNLHRLFRMLRQIHPNQYQYNVRKEYIPYSKQRWTRNSYWQHYSPLILLTCHSQKKILHSEHLIQKRYSVEFY